MKRLLLGLGLILGLAVVIVLAKPQVIRFFNLEQPLVPTNATQPLTQEKIANPQDAFAKEFELVATQSGQTALDLLKANNIIEVKEYDFGTFVKAIDGLVGDNNYYWAFYVNDEYAKTAVDKTILKVGDKIKFVYEKVDTAPLK